MFNYLEQFLMLRVSAFGSSDNSNCSKTVYGLQSNLKDVIKKKNDFTITKCSKSANFNFDLKRKLFCNSVKINNF